MCNVYGYVPKGAKDRVSCRVSVHATAFSMEARLGLLGIEMYQMIKGSHNSSTFIKFLWLVQEHLRLTSQGFTNFIVLDNVVLPKVAHILNEFLMIDMGGPVGQQQLATEPIWLLFLPAYSPFLNPIKEVFRWLKKFVKWGTPTVPEEPFDLLQVGVYLLPATTVERFYLHSGLFILPVLPCSKAIKLISFFFLFLSFLLFFILFKANLIY